MALTRFDSKKVDPIRFRLEISTRAEAAGFDGMVLLWEAEGSRPLAALHGHSGGVRGVALSGDGQLVASAGFETGSFRPGGRKNLVERA